MLFFTSFTCEERSIKRVWYQYNYHYLVFLLSLNKIHNEDRFSLVTCTGHHGYDGVKKNMMIHVRVHSSFLSSCKIVFRFRFVWFVSSQVNNMAPFTFTLFAPYNKQAALRVCFVCIDEFLHEEILFVLHSWKMLMLECSVLIFVRKLIGIHWQCAELISLFSHGKRRIGWLFSSNCRLSWWNFSLSIQKYSVNGCCSVR